jgi:adenine-specific DNA-methyltransferase
MDKVYVVQTSQRIIERCLLMTTDPGDLVLDPTCGSGTTAAVAEQWGRRWITIDTSRVALALARTRLMAARHPPYLLRDSRDGAAKEAVLTGRSAPDGPFRNDIRQGFVLERVPHVTLKSIANNAEIDLIHDQWQPTLDTARAALNTALGTSHQEWEVPRALPASAPPAAHDPHAKFWQARRDRQKQMDAAIARNADTEFLHDRPYQKRNAVRVTGPFTVESLSPHRVLPLPEDDDPALLDAIADEAGNLPPRRPLRPKTEAPAADDFVTVVIDNLLKAGVQNTRKNERMNFASIRPWPGQGHVAAEGLYEEAGQQRRAAIVIGPEYGTVGQDLVRQAVRDCRDWADALVVCGFAFDPQIGESTMNFGRLTVLKARMSQELHAAEAYKAGGGNLFTVFGEPDIALDRKDGSCVVHLKGVDIFDPTTGEVRSSKKVEDDIACWFIDTDYDGDSFFVRHAYFLGGKDPYEKLKAALKADIDPDAWATLYRADSRPFPAPKSGQVAVKVINHYGDEAMKVFRVA